MRRDDFNRFCQSLPHTSHVVQWGGADVWKVGDEDQAKVFAIGMGDGGSGDWLAVSFKCSRMSFDMLMDAPGFRPAPYLASRGMIWLQRTLQESMDNDAFKAYLRESYRLASLNLTKACQRRLGLNQTTAELS
jgi:predicted DNA-binding protein (MmcQ/YjbR family)